MSAPKTWDPCLNWDNTGDYCKKVVAYEDYAAQSAELAEVVDSRKQLAQEIITLNEQRLENNQLVAELELELQYALRERNEWKGIHLRDKPDLESYHAMCVRIWAALGEVDPEKVHEIPCDVQLVKQRDKANKKWDELLARLDHATAELAEVREDRNYWERQASHERAQRQLEVGAQEYRGNTVSYMYDKAKCYGDMVHGCSPALAAAGFPVDENNPHGRIEAIANAVKKMAAALDSARRSTKGEGK